MTFEMVKQNFERKLWSTQMVAVAVKKGVITPEEYQAITGEAYREGEGDA